MRSFRVTTRRLAALALFALAGVAAVVALLSVFELRSVERMVRDAELTSALMDDLETLDRAVESIYEAQRAYSFSGDQRYLGEELRARQGYGEAAARYATDQLDSAEVERQRRVQALVDDWLENVGRPWLQARERNEDVTAFAETADSRVKTIHRAFEDASVRVATDSTRQREAMLVRSRVRMRTAVTLCLLIVGVSVWLWRVGERHLFNAASSITSWVKRLTKGEFAADPPRPKGDQLAALVTALTRLNAASEERERDLRTQLSRERQLGREHASIVHQAERQRDVAVGALAAVPAALIIFENPTGRVMYQNDIATDLVGADSDGYSSTAQRRRRFRVFNLKGRPLSRKDLPLVRVFAGETVGGLPLRLRARDGRTIPILVSGAPLRDGAGRTTAAAIVAQTIT